MNSGKRAAVAVAAAVAGTAWLVAGAAAGQEAGAAGQSVWDGVYTAEQAERGLRSYGEHCQTCHAEDLHGGPGGPALAGPEFMFGWNGQSADALLAFIKGMMPPGAAGSLSDQQYADLVAVIFAANGFPAGAAELPAAPEALGGIIVTRQP